MPIYSKRVFGMLRVAAAMAVLGASVCANAQKLTVVAVSHNTKEFDYQTTTPQNSQTNCTVNDPSVNCNTTTYGGQTHTNAVYRLDQEVTANGLRYKLTRTARWRWSSLDWLTDGESFPAEIKGRHMYITCRRGGNQGKKETIKYEVLDIRPVQ
jgi:hypothetical protein